MQRHVEKAVKATSKLDEAIRRCQSQGDLGTSYFEIRTPLKERACGEECTPESEDSERLSRRLFDDEGTNDDDDDDDDVDCGGSYGGEGDCNVQYDGGPSEEEFGCVKDGGTERGCNVQYDDSPGENAMDRYDDVEYKRDFFGVSDSSTLACEVSHAAESEQPSSILDLSSLSLEEYGREESSPGCLAEAMRDGAHDPPSPQAEACLRGRQAEADAKTNEALPIRDCRRSGSLAGLVEVDESGKSVAAGLVNADRSGTPPTDPLPATALRAKDVDMFFKLIDDDPYAFIAAFRRAKPVPAEMRRGRYGVCLRHERRRQWDDLCFIGLGIGACQCAGTATCRRPDDPREDDVNRR